MPTPSQKMIDLLQQLVEGQEKQNHLLKFITDTLSSERRERTAILDRWKSANPLLSAACREAAETLSKACNTTLSALTDEVVNQSEAMVEHDFTRQELIDRFGPRMQHLNALTFTLQQVGGPLNPLAPARETR